MIPLSSIRSTIVERANSSDFAIASRPEVIFCSFGDMLRVPGSRGDLLQLKSLGSDVRVVYSPLDAVNPAAAQKMPLPPAATPPPRAQLGLRIRWIVYRAPDTGGEVLFDQESNAPVVGGTSTELTNTATFSAPGAYWLRAIATDGTLETPYDLKVTVIGNQR